MHRVRRALRLGDEPTLGGKLPFCLLYSSDAVGSAPSTPTCSGNMKTVLFCSHKGGPGKTSLLSHTVSQYAQSHPERTVLLIDCSIPADVTRQVLGGDHDFKGEENFDKVRVSVPPITHRSIKLFTSHLYTFRC